MAHYKRKRPSTCATRLRWKYRERRALEKGIAIHHPYRKVPGWWNRIHHIRPARRLCHQIEQALLTGDLDPDDATWPVAKKPHVYYW